MRQMIFALLGVLGLALPLAAQQYVTIADKTVSSVAVTVFTAADIQAGSGHTQTTAASCSLTGGNIRVTFDGTTPTTSLGEVVFVGGPYVFAPSQNLINMQAIRDDATDGVLACVLIRP